MNQGKSTTKKATQKSAKSTTVINKKSKGFTDEERAAMKERAALHTKADEELGKLIAPVLKALEEVEPVIATPPAAQAALDALTIQMAKAGPQTPKASSNLVADREGGLTAIPWEL